MEKKNLLLLIVFGALLAISLGLVLRSKADRETKNEHRRIIEIKNYHLDNAIEYIDMLEKQIDTLERIVEVAYNSAVHFEMLVGVKEPDGIVTYKEKLLITSERMNKIKNNR